MPPRSEEDSFLGLNLLQDRDATATNAGSHPGLADTSALKHYRQTTESCQIHVYKELHQGMRIRPKTLDTAVLNRDAIFTPGLSSYH